MRRNASCRHSAGIGMYPRYTWISTACIGVVFLPRTKYLVNAGLASLSDKESAPTLDAMDANG